MGYKTKASIFFLILLLLLSLVAAGFYFISYDNEKRARQDLTGQFNSLNEKSDKIKKLLDQTSKQKIILERKTSENEKTISELDERLTAQIKNKASLLDKQTDLQERISGLNQERNDYKDRLEKTLSELTDIQGQLQEAVSVKNELEMEISKITEEQNAKQESEANEAEVLKKLIPPFSTQVLLVNREHEFLVLDAGEDKGLELGQTFEIFHKGTSLGRVQVEKVHKEMSAAKFLEGFNLRQVKEKDIANRIN